jgi:hypothetical protein
MRLYAIKFKVIHTLHENIIPLEKTMIYDKLLMCSDVLKQIICSDKVKENIQYEIIT